MAKIKGQAVAGKKPAKTKIQPTMPGVSQATMPKVRGLFASGVTVVTTAHEGRLHGMTVSAFSALSLDPPLVLVCLANDAATGEMIAASGIFVVSILGDEQEFLSERFAARAPIVNEEFEGVPYHVEATGAPVLDRCIAWYDCRVEAMYDGGDHTIFIGCVEALGIKDQTHPPLLYYANRYARLEE
jgi:flavin reductase (DIM6/NTAB) family NADH-FMN oxidoreductase RutF